MRVLSMDGHTLAEAQKVTVRSNISHKYFYLTATIISASVGMADVQLAEYGREEDALEEMERMCAFFEAHPDGLYRVEK